MAQEVIVRSHAAPLQFKAYIELMKLRIGSMIALCAVMGYAAVARRFDAVEILVLVLALLASSAAASIFNHVWERDIDALMQRTNKRPMVTGVIADARNPLFLAGILLSVGVAVIFSTFNGLAALYLFLGAFFYAIVYTVWLKRRSWLNIVVGGLAGSFAVLAGGAAASPDQWRLPLLLAVVLFFWTPSHFWALAILLKEDYARARIPMLPVLAGEALTARAIFANSLLLTGSAALPWLLGDLGIAYALLSSLLGVWLLWGNRQLVLTPEPACARRNFFASIQYLSGLFLAVLIDVGWTIPL
jgi:protoheme IX farnesyltransferase